MHIVLILAHADRLGINLHQLRQRILQAPPDRDRAADRQVEVGKLIARHLRRAVDRRTGFIDGDHHDVFDIRLFQHAAHERLGFASAGTVAHRDGRRTVLSHQLADVDFRLDFAPLALGGKDGAGLHEFAGGVQRDAFAACAQAGIDADHLLLAERRLQQQVAQVLREDLHRRAVGLHLGLDHDIDLDTRRDQPFVAVLDRLFQMRRKARGGIQLEQLTDARQERGRVARHAHAQHTLGLAAADRQKPVGGDLAQPLREIVILLELGRLCRFGIDHLRRHHALRGERLAHQAAHLRVFGDGLGHDIARTRQRGLHIRHAFFRIHKRGRNFGGTCGGVLRQNQLGQRFETLFARDHGARAAFGLIRQIQIFEHRLSGTGKDFSLQFRRQLALFFDGCQNRRAPVFHFPVVGQTLLNL